MPEIKILEVAFCCFFVKFISINHMYFFFQDTQEFALNFTTEAPIKQGTFSSQDKDLLERITAQVLILIELQLDDLCSVFLT